MSTKEWEQALDGLEERLSLHRGVLAGAPAVPEFEFPDGLGPFPAELVTRARGLLGLLVELQAELEAQVSVLGSRLSRRPESRLIPLYLDARA